MSTPGPTPGPTPGHRHRPVTPQGPKTPLRPSSRSSFRESSRGNGDGPLPLNAFEPAFAELSDAMADLEANMMHFQLMHESLARFSESFASFLYGLNMNAFCVDFPEAPIPESFGRDRSTETRPASSSRSEPDMDNTFMTTDMSFVENPSTVTKPKAAAPKSTAATRKTAASAPASGSTARQSRLPAARGPSAPTRGRGDTRGARGRPSGLARARGRGVR